MNIIKASAGWLWLRQGFSLFKKQPFELLMLFFSLMLFNFVLNVIPILGSVTTFLLGPVLMMGFMHACREVDNGQRISIGFLVLAFRSPALKNLLLLGCLHILALLLAFAGCMLFDQGLLWSFISTGKTLDAKAIQQTNIVSSFILIWLLHLPASMAFWFAAPLVMWHGMSTAKAVFFSFIAAWRARRAFLVYGLSCFGVLFTALIVFSMVAALFSGNADSVKDFLLPLMIPVAVIMYCSFYCSYHDVFGRERSA